MRNQRGSVSILSLFIIMVLLVLLAYVTDVARLQAIKIHSRHSLNLALRAASAQIDMEAYNDAENPRLVIKEADAEAVFYQILRENLSLNTNNEPYAGSAADGRVEVCYFRVIQEGDLPYSYSYGDYSETINRVSCTGIIKVPVRLSPFARFSTGLPEHTYQYVHSTVGPEARK
ncbi:MAG TPA: hypothetical protein DD791_10380 [Syntrophomonas sp.]|mgnify:FL=1|nr:hypothetical protein [Syntrophomonas sp.]